MNFPGSIGFLEPWLLSALLALPILWWLLRAVPPAPFRRRFPAVSLLLGLADRQTTPVRTPWWMLLLRILAIATAILAFAQPVLNPSGRVGGGGRLLIVMDGSWASAQSWAARQDKVTEILQFAAQDARPAAVVLLSSKPQRENPFGFENATGWSDRVDGLQPNAWEPVYGPWIPLIDAAQGFETIWISDGLERGARKDLMEAFAARGKVSIIESHGVVLALRGIGIDKAALTSTVLRIDAGTPGNFTVQAEGLDPLGVTRTLARTEGSFDSGQTVAGVELELPSELRNRVRRIAIDGVRSAGAVVVADDSIKRRKVALIAGSTEQEGAILISPLHFLRKALVPSANVIEASLADSLQARPDVLIFADVGELGTAETQAVRDWVERGGLLVRFAGPRLARSELGQGDEHPLLPVRLRAGGRKVGGTMSWSVPKALQDFAQDSPFFGLGVPDDVLVESQVVAQPGPTLANRVLARLQDGTPLVTAKDLGAGRVVLFHVTANAQWSSLPLSGLFVQLLERLAISARTSQLDAAQMAGSVWIPERVFDGFGVLHDGAGLAGVEGARLAKREFGADMPPGIYASGAQRVAVNALAADRELSASDWPARTPVLSMTRVREHHLQAWLLLAALALLCADIVATLWVGGRLRMGVRLAILLLLALPVERAQAQDEAPLLKAANNTVLAYVETGDLGLDDVSRAGLLGLSTELFRRTSVEPVEPVGVNVQSGELSLYPFIYWPVTDTHEQLSQTAVENVNRYLRGGGLILFDTRDANTDSGLTGGTPNARMLQQITQNLDVPLLEPIPQDHVLTRAFYLLQDFPGRYRNADVWVEASLPDVQRVDGMPFRKLNDGATPVVIGGNDWARAWAVDRGGRFMFPVGRGVSGERQREIAIRFGVNLIMHALTGNYKSDQVHIPALLERLGYEDDL